jgi:hypothetical protein
MFSSPFLPPKLRILGEEMKHLLLLGLICSTYLLIGCGSSSKRVESGLYESKQPKYLIEVDKNGRKQGMETWWYPDGVKKYVATNRAGIREGQFTAWHPNGKIWYQGYERAGIPESTLTYWYPSGGVKNKAVFQAGIQLERQDFTEEGQPIFLKGTVVKKYPVLKDSIVETETEGARLRNLGLQSWASRVRQTVEGYWVLPKQFNKERSYRTVAKIKVARDGKILGVSWIEKSPSASFNTLAQQTLKRIKRLPAFPPMIKDLTLDVQYEFISLGKQAPRRKLELRGSRGDEAMDAEKDVENQESSPPKASD